MVWSKQQLEKLGNSKLNTKPREKSSEMDPLQQQIANLVDEILPAKNMQQRLERLGSKFGVMRTSQK